MMGAPQRAFAASATLPPPPPMIQDACTVERVSDEGAFLALEREWNDAVERADVPHPFLRHEWVRTWWEAFGGGGSLHILVARAGGRIAAIAPLMRDTAPMYGVPVRRVRFLQNDHTPRTDVIVASHREAALRAIWSALYDERSQWDLVQLNQIERTSPTLDAVTRLAEASRCQTGVWPSNESPYLPLAGTWEDVQATLPAKFRSNLRNRLSRLTRIGEPALEVLEDAGAIRAAAADAFRLEESGWKGEEGTAIGSDPAVQHFYSALIDRAAAAGWLQLLFLTVGGRRIATSYGARFANRLFLFKTGYDPEFAQCAPFKLLTSFAIQEACAQGLSEVDFLGDTEPWKREWTQAARGHDWLFVFNGSVRARLLHSIKFQWVPELKRWRA